MHYANGRSAKVGDLVKGKGYNFKYEITGILISAQPDLSACNCIIAHVSQRSQVWSLLPTGSMEDFRSVISEIDNNYRFPQRIEADLEYGQLDAFVAIDPETGETLS